MDRFAPIRIGLAAAGVALGLFASALASASPASRSARSSDEEPAFAPCSAVSDGSIAGHGYLYCGYHWASWPITYGIDLLPAPKPATIKVTQAQFNAAVNAAAAEWNTWWQRLHPDSNKFPFALSAASGNRVRFASLATTATTDLEFPLGTKIYNKSTIKLNSNITWRAASDRDLATGEVPALTTLLSEFGSACVTTSGDCHWNDVQNIMTHEFGHMLGLEHIDEACFPSDLLHPESTQATMYACTFETETNKRSLDWGDILGLRRVGEDST